MRSIMIDTHKRYVYTVQVYVLDMYRYGQMYRSRYTYINVYLYIYV